jgi:hypothetical protein
LLRAPVVIRGIRLGEVQDVIVAAAEPRIIGLDVICGDGENRFLPFSTARLNGKAIEIESTLTLLDARELEFYRANGRSLSEAPSLVVPLAARC